MKNAAVIPEGRGDGYEVVLEDGGPVVFLEPASPGDDRWLMDLRGTPLLTVEEILGRPPPPPPRPPQLPPPSRPRPSTPPTRARALRARRTGSPSPAPTAAGPGSGSPHQAGDAEGDGGEDPDPPAPEAGEITAEKEPSRLGGKASRAKPAPIPARSSTPWLNSEEAQAYLRFETPDALYHAVARGRVPAHRLGRRLLFDRDELEALVRDGTRDCPPVTIQAGVRRHRGGQR